MTNTHRHNGGVRPTGVLTHDSMELPDGLPFTAHALTVRMPGLSPLPALLLIPKFTATMTDSVGDTYSPLPFMLDLEGFEHVDAGVPLPLQLKGAPAEQQGWALRRRRDQVEVSRRHKVLYRGPLDTFPAEDADGEAWRCLLAMERKAVVLVPETQPREKLLELVAVSVTGSWAVMRARNF
ncbi:hypothetical protein [Streptomyces sp. NPDC015125]|uniref:hypothetical protein n=1 Tax=Streptomyces sp. NPDC015125 TaxID=3364938 RepID=UPI0037013962